MSRRSDLTSPRQRRRLGVHYDTDAFGNFSEAIARTLGTARFLVFQTSAIAAWMVWNTVAPQSWRYDSYPFQFLNVALSLQAAYAAPLILLAQSRQEQRDRLQSDLDRRVAERTQADTEFLARELASARLALADVATTTDIDDRLDRLTRAVERIANRLDTLDASPDPASPEVRS
jgi:uncharacterized membrane protein